MLAPPEKLVSAEDSGKGRRTLYAEVKGDRGVMQGDPLSSTIFNVVVDAVVRHWGLVMTESAEERGGRGK